MILFKNFFFLLFIFLSFSTSAEKNKYSPEIFDAKNKRKETMSISWMTVPMQMVQDTCDLVSKDLELGGFNYSLTACSFWTAKTCVIVTADYSTHEEIGHELRHCFQGSFH